MTQFGKDSTNNVKTTKNCHGLMDVAKNAMSNRILWQLIMSREIPKALTWVKRIDPEQKFTYDLAICLVQMKMRMKYARKFPGIPKTHYKSKRIAIIMPAEQYNAARMLQRTVLKTAISQKLIYCQYLQFCTEWHSWFKVTSWQHNQTTKRFYR